MCGLLVFFPQKKLLGFVLWCLKAFFLPPLISGSLSSMFLETQIIRKILGEKSIILVVLVNKGSTINSVY